MKQCMDSENLHRRLKKIIGQVQAIDRMIDEDVPCEDVLSQINTAKSALHGCRKVVLEGHIKHGDADKTLESFTKAVERLSTRARSPLRFLSDRFICVNAQQSRPHIITQTISDLLSESEMVCG